MKIALVGSAPASIRIAPYQDPTWKIYACSPGTYGIIPRVDEFFEMHLWEPGQPWFSPEYVQWMTALPKNGATLWVGGPVPSIPEAKLFPFEDVLRKYDPDRFFCSSSLFWMMARAIEAILDEAGTQGREVNPEQDKIAFYGVDMAATSEYEMQRAGIHYLTTIVRERKLAIEIGAPPESDLFTPRFRYGADEWTHSFRKWRARRAELEARKAQADQQRREGESGVHFLSGALDDLDYMHGTWADKTARCAPTPYQGESA